MQIKNFVYNDKPREVIVIEESTTHLKGFDISSLDNDEKEKARLLLKDIDYSKIEPEKLKEEYSKSQYLMKYYKNFKKENIVEPKRKDGD